MRVRSTGTLRRTMVWLASIVWKVTNPKELVGMTSSTKKGEPGTPGSSWLGVMMTQTRSPGPILPPAVIFVVRQPSKMMLLVLRTVKGVATTVAEEFMTDGV